MRQFRVIVRTRYDDPTSDAIQDFPARDKAEEHLIGLGFAQHESIGWVTHYYLPAVSPRGDKVRLAGYLVEVNG